MEAEEFAGSPGRHLNTNARNFAEIARFWDIALPRWVSNLKACLPEEKFGVLAFYQARDRPCMPVATTSAN
jgi:hypothetical protein